MPHEFDAVVRNEIDYEHTQELVCPYCGHEQRDSWEMADSSEKTDCGECQKFFQYESYAVRYFTSKKADCLNGAPHNFQPQYIPGYPHAVRCTLCRENIWGQFVKGDGK